MYSEQIKKLNKEAFEAAKALLTNNGDRICIYFPDSERAFEAIIFDGSFVDDMHGYVGKGVKLIKSGRDPFGERNTLEIRIGNTYGTDCWVGVERLNPLCYAAMYDFVKNNLAQAMTLEEAG